MTLHTYIDENDWCQYGRRTVSLNTCLLLLLPMINNIHISITPQYGNVRAGLDVARHGLGGGSFSPKTKV